MPSFCSNLICVGTSTRSLPLGPCTSTLPPAELIFTPAGIGIGLRPIRDICSVPFSQTLLLKLVLTPLPHFAKNLATDVGFAGRASGHQSLWSGEDTDAEASDNRANVH